MSPPREQMQFVSNLILSQLVFPLVPHRSIWTAAERGLLLSCVICLFSYRTTDVSQNSQLCVVLVLEKTNWKTRKDLITTAECALNKVGHFQWQVTFWPRAPEGMQGVPLFVSAKRKIFHHVTDLSNYFLQPKKNGGDEVIKHSTELWPPFQWEQVKSDVVLGPHSLQRTSLGVGDRYRCLTPEHRDERSVDSWTERRVLKNSCG